MTERDCHIAGYVVGAWRRRFASAENFAMSVAAQAALEQLIAKALRAEREASAKLCDAEAAQPSDLWAEPGCWIHAAENCAAAIRAMGES